MLYVDINMINERKRERERRGERERKKFFIMCLYLLERNKFFFEVIRVFFFKFNWVIFIGLCFS